MTNERRLDSRILAALNQALDQKETEISEILLQALELSLTRGAGGKEFVERRDLSQDVLLASERLFILKSGAKT